MAVPSRRSGRAGPFVKMATMFACCGSTLRLPSHGSLAKGESASYAWLSASDQPVERRLLTGHPRILIGRLDPD